MSDTPNLALPLIAAAQAQKHITVNEALSRLDALASPTAVSMDLSVPPVGAPGDAYIIGAGATGVWAGRDRELAFWVNDGWSFAAPKTGWRVWLQDRRVDAIYVDGDWTPNLVGPAAFGAHTELGLVTGDVTLAGPVTTTGFSIPDRAIVFGVTGRVISSISGSGVTGWRLGVAGFEDRYGTEIGLQQGSMINGVTSETVGYYADTPLTVSAEGGDFSGGQVRLAIHFLSLTAPKAV